jgi:hypothetical protein
MRAPLMCRALIRAASWLVPARVRSEWLASRSAELYDWWYLVEHGEPVRDSGGALCRRAWRDAFDGRFGEIKWQQFVRAPMFVPIVAGVALLALALASHGFAVTRHVLSIARDMHDNPAAGYDARGDRIAVYAAPLLMALATGLTLLVVGCLSLGARSWRYWGFLALKAVVVLVLFPLIWVEIGTALRSHFSSITGRVLCGLFTVVIFVIAMGRGMIWCVADQRRRCRACLRRLVLPVSVGSWASQFEPSATEMLCEDGHGSLALSNRETNVEDRWTNLDDSWKALFR